MLMDDWWCNVCNFKIYARKDSCRKCGTKRNGGGGGGGNAKPKKKFPGDWICKGCNELLFANKIKCFKCNLDKVGNPVETENKIEVEKCLICTVADANALFVHEGETDGHRVSCYPCALEVKNSGNAKCPVCMQYVKQVVKIW